MELWVLIENYVGVSISDRENFKDDQWLLEDWWVGDHKVDLKNLIAIGAWTI